MQKFYAHNTEMTHYYEIIKMKSAKLNFQFKSWTIKTRI